MRRVVFLLLLCLAACTAIPVSTLAKFSRFDERDFAALDGGVIRLRISLPRGYALDVPSCRLDVSVQTSGGAYRGQFRLEQEASAPRTIAAGWLAPPQATTAYVLRLSPKSVEEFRALQKVVGPSSTSDIKLDVAMEISSAPRDAKSVTVWVDALLSTPEGYFTLIDGRTLPLGSKETYKGAA